MAEQAPSRLSKSRLDPEADEEGETFLREPAPVPRPEDFFNIPAKSFDINSIPHYKDEFGIAIKKHQNGDELGEANEEEQSLQSSLPGSLKGYSVVSTSQTNRIGSESSVQAGREVGMIGMPLQIPGSLIDASFKGNQIEAVNIIGKSTDSNAQDLTHRNTTLQTAEDLYPNIQKDQSSSEHFNSSGVQQEAATPVSLFPSTQDDQGLVLSGPLGSTPYQEPNDEEEDMVPLLPLSEISIMPPLRDETGLPFSSSVAAESTFLENANLQRWDLFDNSQSDVYLDDGFIFPRNQESRSLETSDTKHEANPRVSPFAAYIPSDSQKEAEPSGRPSGGLKATSDREVDHPDDETDDDKVDVAHVLEALAGAATSSELMKKFLDKDSGDESNSTGNAEQPSQPQPSSQKKIAPSSGSTLDNHSSSDDGLTFDEGAGVGIGFKPIQKTHPGHESIVSDGMDSEPSPRKFTTAEKGKQVDRDPLPVAETQDRSVHDFPLIGSLNDSDLKEIKEIGGAILSMLKSEVISKPSAISPHASQSEEPRTRIYPAAPPEPWASKPLDSRLSQRRPPSATARTEASEHDPNLGFMSSARKHTPVIQPTPTGTKSLLSDYPDTASKPATVAPPPAVTLPSDPSKAPVLRGQYELPSIKKIDQWKSKNSLAPNSFRRLLINIGALIASNIVMKARIYRSVVTFLSSLLSPLVFYWIEWAVLLLLLFNIAEVIYSYTQSTNNFENLPLTPSQRSLLGLDPIVSKVPGAVPVFRKSATLPHNLTERPIMSTYVSPSHGAFAPTKPSFQKATVASTGLEYKDATIILNKSMSRSFNQSAVQDKADLNRLMRNIEAREELQAEWKSSDADPAKRPFGLHGSFGAPQGSLQTGVDMSVPDLLASLNSRGPVNRYQPALRTTLSKDHTSKTDLQKDGLYVVGYGKVLKNLKVSEHQLDRWAFNLRKWLWNKVVKHVCSEMEIVDAELARQGLSYLDCKSATMFYASVPLPQNTVNGTSSTAAAAAPAAPAPLSSSLAWGAASIANTRLPSAFATTQPQQPQLPTSLQDLEARYGESRIVKQRIYLESYLAVPGYANRKYVVERLQAMGPLLTHFIWDSHGVTWDGGKKTWSPDLPSDSQIIMHLFMTYIDSAMPSHPSQVYDRFPFTYKHYVPVDNKPDPTTALQIKQTSKNPPDYSLVVEGSMWEVVPKRLNVWYTMVLFIYMVMKENAGYIGQINIGTQMIGLGDVVEGYDM
ncbi:hypothetical protein BGX26_012265 [Mortierella sp. AD094]|nr:hypothetical protein BGX26_012265 [Mortierella sp. AD094]